MPAVESSRGSVVEGSHTEAVVAGHVCLDLIPQLFASHSQSEPLFAPGRLVRVGPVAASLGGAVANTGVLLHRFGIATRLIGNVGDDLFGKATLARLRYFGANLANHMLIDRAEASSYTLVISPPEVDRCFLHCPGANDSFRPQDVDLALCKTARLFHFGYPPLMRSVYQDDGIALAKLLASIRRGGTLTSLDMAMPDPASPAGRVNWHSWLANVLPEVDLFLPSFDEILLMLDRKCYERLQSQSRNGNLAATAHPELFIDISRRLLALGCKLVVLKLGDQGLYLRSAEAPPECSSPTEWHNRELLVPCFEVDVMGTTGSGDATIAGFLTALLRGMPPEQAMLAAAGVGAYSVENADPLTGMPPWNQVIERIPGWRQRPLSIALTDWCFDSETGVWHGPRDARYRTTSKNL